MSTCNGASASDGWAKRQVAAVGGDISAKNRVRNNDIATSARTHSKGTSEEKQGGLIVTITLPKLSNAAFAS